MRCARIAVGLFALSLLSACRSESILPGPSAAESTMREFFLALSKGRYADGAALYSGAYDDPLASMNPDVDPLDHALLFERYCTQNGGVCLPVKDVLRAQPTDTGLVFTVHFANPDGSTFAQGPCCGEAAGDPVTKFDVLVSTTGDDTVLTLPPYVP
jgi:hypothetical protein